MKWFVPLLLVLLLPSLTYGFPVVEEVVESSWPSSVVSHQVGLPSSVDSGDLLLLSVGLIHESSISTALNIVESPSGWTPMVTDLAVNGDYAGEIYGIYAKVADGSEAGTFVSVDTDAGSTGAAQVYRISNWQGDLSGLEISSEATLLGDSPNPPSLTPGWGAEDTLWIALVLSFDDDAAIVSYPSGYSNGVQTLSGGGINLGPTVGSAVRELNAVSEDPGVFTFDSSEGYSSFTIAVRDPVACVVLGDLTGDCVVDISDVLIVAGDIGKSSGFDNRADRNGDGLVNVFDLVLVARYFGNEEQPPADTTAPVRSNGAPSGTLTPGTSSATFSLSTSEGATCSYSESGGVSYSSMSLMSTTGGTSHSQLVSVSDGTSYDFYVKCQDANGNTNSDDYRISFSVGSSAGGLEGHPNEPSGFVQMFQADGSAYVGDQSDFGGDREAAFNITGFRSWYGYSGDLSERFEVVADPENPTGSGYSVRTTYVPPSGAADTIFIDQNGDAYSDVYIALRVIIESGWDPSHKWFYINLVNHTAGVGPIATRELTDSMLVSAPGPQLNSGPGVLSLRDEEMLIEWRFKMPSSVGAGDGEVWAWVNGEQVVHGTNWDVTDYWEPDPVPGTVDALVNGIIVYWTSNSFETESYRLMREFYMSGKPRDTSPPFRDNGSPSGTLNSDTTSATLSLDTDEAATCAYSDSSGLSYSSMTQMSTTGGTSHSHDVSVSDGQSYSYYVKCRDSSGNVNGDDFNISFSVANQTPVSDLHPNEPVGMNELMQADGSVAESGGNAFGISGWSGWYLVGGGSADVFTVSDPGNPLGSGSAVRRHWRPDVDGGGTADYNYPGGPYREVYVALRLVHRMNNTNHKFYYHILHDEPLGSNHGPWPTMESNSNVKLTACGENVIDYTTVPGMDDLNREILLEWYWVAESSNGANDGEVYYWIDGELIGSATGITFSCYTSAPNYLFKGWHFYGESNDNPEFYEDIRELYISARN